MALCFIVGLGSSRFRRRAKWGHPGMMRWLLLIGLALQVSMRSFAEESSRTSAPYFQKEIRPLLKQYCFGCHSAEKHKGDFDMERFASVTEVKRHSKMWQEVAEK